MEFGPDRHPSEFVFVPTSAESEGWLVGFVADAVAASTDFDVLSAMDVAAPAVATVHVPHLIPRGFHGNWVSQ